MVKLSKRKADALSNGVFLVAIGILFFTKAWWPGILLAIWATLATRQLLTARKIDFIISTVILVGLFIVSYFDINLSSVLPVAFVTGGVYLVLREYFFNETPDDDIER